MNAALLGLSLDQIDERYDKIVKFADIGEYIDQPVKSYSSGMYVRLAFAVIAHVDAEILVIDEALAVGDAIFTQKCMRFIRDFKKNGTLLFVSHDMNSVLNLCERAIWLDQGKVHQAGKSKNIAEAYLQYTLQEIYGEDTQLQEVTPEKKVQKKRDDINSKNHPAIYDYNSQAEVINNLNAANGWKSGDGEILEVNLHCEDKNLSNIVFKGGEIVHLHIKAIAYKDMANPILGFLVRDRLGQDLFGENTLPFTSKKSFHVSSNQIMLGEFVFKLPMLPNGQYAVMASLAEGDLYNNTQHHWLHDAMVINVSSSKIRWGLVGIAFQNVSLKHII
jgi:lipopolysaccharide transport system ATP-binding protein